MDELEQIKKDIEEIKERNIPPFHSLNFVFQKGLD